MDLMLIQIGAQYVNALKEEEGVAEPQTVVVPEGVVVPPLPPPPPPSRHRHNVHQSVLTLDPQQSPPS